MNAVKSFVIIICGLFMLLCSYPDVTAINTTYYIFEFSAKNFSMLSFNFSINQELHFILLN